MRPIRKNVYTIVSDLDATIEEATSDHWGAWRTNIDAPIGHCWGANGNHCLVVMGDCKPELWEDALERMSYGIVFCNEPECDQCNYDGDIQHGECKPEWWDLTWEDA